VRVRCMRHVRASLWTTREPPKKDSGECEIRYIGGRHWDWPRRQALLTLHILCSDYFLCMKHARACAPHAQHMYMSLHQ
jgi:hypothetical protein